MSGGTLFTLSIGASTLHKTLGRLLTDVEAGTGIAFLALGLELAEPMALRNPRALLCTYVCRRIGGAARWAGERRAAGTSGGQGRQSRRD
jgi:hypothetical protein